MNDNIKKLLDEASEGLKAAVNLEDAEKLRVAMMGKKGKLTEILRSMKDLAPEERKSFGQAVNEAKAQFENMLAAKVEELKEAQKEAKFKAETIDVTEPGISRTPGYKHLVTLVIDDTIEFFTGLGFTVAEGPEIDTVHNNFDALNAGPNHPSRDMTDTFYISDSTLLRTQTSDVQARVIAKGETPIRLISPGRVFRCDTPDATHSPMFHQIEGLVVDEGITMADLKGILDMYAKHLFGSHLRTKLRPHHFPFTEPSAEMDVECFKCGGKGCNVCKGSGWIEILGCGMVHPNVLKFGGIDTEKYTGFAFGVGVERIAMLKYGIDDMRLLYENDIRFIEQFR